MAVRSAVGIVCAALAAVGTAQAVPVDGFQRMSTGPMCDPGYGEVHLGLDVFGSFGSATEIDQDATFNPANDRPDVGARGTIFESMPFLCVSAGGDATGHYLETRRIG